MPLSTKQSVALALTLGAVVFFGIKFFNAAGARAVAMRDEACRPLAPEPVAISLRNQAAPDFELPDRTGKKWSLKSLRGRPVLLNFWFSTCPPCIEEMADLENLQKRLGDDLVVLAISVDEEGWPAIEKFFGASGTHLSVVLDQDKAVSKKYNVEKFPETFLIDRAGQIRGYFVNKRRWASAEAEECVRATAIQ